MSNAPQDSTSPIPGAVQPITPTALVEGLAGHLNEREVLVARRVVLIEEASADRDTLHLAVSDYEFTGRLYQFRLTVTAVTE